ncbi:MAG: hypothetical protein AcusKO_23040 [Acuticoccus sp.]
MKAAGRITAAIEVLNDIEARRRPAADALKDWGLSHRFAGSGDRAAIANLVYDALRWRRSSAFRADADTARGVVLATLRFHWGVGLADLGTMAGEEHGFGALSDAETAALAADRIMSAPAAVAVDVPDWVATALEDNFDEEWQVEAAALATRAPLDLRVNTLKSDRDKVMRQLARFFARRDNHQPDRRATAGPRRLGARRQHHPRGPLPARPHRSAGRTRRARSRRCSSSRGRASRCSTCAPAPAARRWRSPRTWKTAARSTPPTPTPPSLPPSTSG